MGLLYPSLAQPFTKLHGKVEIYGTMALIVLFNFIKYNEKHTRSTTNTTEATEMNTITLPGCVLLFNHILWLLFFLCSGKSLT